MNKRKVIYIVLLIIVLMLIGLGVLKDYNNKVEKKRLSTPAYITEYKLSIAEMDVMLNGFYVDTTPDLDHASWIMNLNKSKWPDYSDVRMSAAELTEKVVEVLNYDLFEEKKSYNEDAIKKAKEYGFSKENKLTVEWVMKHPKEAVVIMDGLDLEYNLYIRHQKTINERYNKIIKMGKN